MNFIRKLLGITDLRNTIRQLVNQLNATNCEVNSLRRTVEELEEGMMCANARHLKLQGQMITYAIQQRRKEAAYEVQSITCDIPPGSFKDLFEQRKPSNGPASLRDTFGDTVTDRAVAALSVADPLPVNHYAVNAQAARNKRYSTLAASECAALHVPYSHAEWRSVRDHYSNHSPSWFCPELVTLGQVRNRALLLADEEKIELKQVKNAKRTFVNSYPAPLLIRAQFELHNEAVLNDNHKDQQ